MCKYTKINLLHFNNFVFRNLGSNQLSGEIPDFSNIPNVAYL